MNHLVYFPNIVRAIYLKFVHFSGDIYKSISVLLFSNTEKLFLICVGCR